MENEYIKVFEQIYQKCNELDFEEIYESTTRISHFTEILSSDVVRYILDDCKGCEEKGPKQWNKVYRLRNQYRQFHSQISEPDENNIIYRKNWYGRKNSNEDKVLSPLEFAEQIVLSIKDKVGIPAIESFLYTWFGADGLNELTTSCIERIIYAVKHNQQINITDDMGLVANPDKVVNVKKDQNQNLKYFDKSHKIT
jgi:hypothetical protein